MQKVSYVGDGSTTEFTFNFPYFENTNIVVTKNGTTATGYSVVGTSAGVDADIPYTGGKVVFETAPSSIDNITISRNLPMSRVADYQPTAKIEPTTLNQDLNYMMEVLKDLQDELDGFSAQYADIVDKDSTAILLTKIAAIHDEIVAVSAQIIALGDISTITSNISSLQQSVSNLTTTSGNHTTSIGTLDTRTSGLLDYVIEVQAPAADNNYTWYRKYKSGWVEQGGQITTSDGTVTLPKAFNNTNYNIVLGMYDSASPDDARYCRVQWRNKTGTGFIIQSSYDGSYIQSTIDWRVCGYITPIE